MHMHLSHHAENRMRQRGMRDEDIATLCWFADIDIPMGRNLSAMRLSRHAALEARSAGVPGRVLDRLGRLVAVESDDGVIVTCARLNGTQAAAYRRRAARKFWRN